VVDESTGEPAANFELRLFDKDLASDQHLGTATTDHLGRFEFSFAREDFKDNYLRLFGIRINVPEFNPDLFFRVYYQGTLIADLKDEVMRNVRDREVDVDVKVRIPDEAKGRGER
jgi:hypothetical protein